MAPVERVILIAVIATTLVNVASAIAGFATYESFPYPTKCGYGGPEQVGTNMVAAISSFIWKREDCGKFYRVRCVTGSSGSVNCCKNGEIRVKIIETCPHCQPNDISLSMEAFNTISQTDFGRIDVEYYPV